MIHIGNVLNHYFSVIDPKFFKKLKPEYFERVPSADDVLLNKLDTSNPVKTFDWKAKKRKVKKANYEEEDKEDIPILDQDIESRINSYKAIYRKKGREEYELTV